MDEARIPRGVVPIDGAPVNVHFDGACQPPTGPGIAAYAYTIEGPGLDIEEWGLATRPYSEHSTNNVAEYVGAIRALEWLHERAHRGPLVVTGDSQLVIRQMTGEYEVRTEHLKAYHDRLVQLAREFASVTWVWVPRDQNSRADALSKRAIADASTAARRRRPLGDHEVRPTDEIPDGPEPGAEPD